MPNKFRLWRKAGTGPRPHTSWSPPDGAMCPDAFQAWSRACADLVRAEHAGDVDHALVLAVAVMRAHNTLTRERLAGGWEPAPNVLTYLERDEQLVNIHPDPDHPDA